MPMLVKYTDQICVEKNRDILFVQFNYDVFEDKNKDNLREETPFIRETLEFFKNNEIGYELIGPFSNSGVLGGYYGRYYIDVPYETSNTKYKIIEDYFETSDGSMRDENKIFGYCSLEHCKVVLAYSEEYWNEL